MTTTTYDTRSGWDTFAAILLFTFAFVRIISAINYFGDGANVNDLTNSVFGDQLWIWGIWDLCLAVLGLFAAVSLLRRRRLRSGDRVHLGRVGARAELPDHRLRAVVRGDDDPARHGDDLRPRLPPPRER